MRYWLCVDIKLYREGVQVQVREVDHPNGHHHQDILEKYSIPDILSMLLQDTHLIFNCGDVLVCYGGIYSHYKELHMQKI